MRITRSQLRKLICEATSFQDVQQADAPPWFDSGYSKFQSNLNDFLDSAGYEPGVWYYWNDEDTLVMLGGEEDAIEIQLVLDIGSDQKRWNSPEMKPSVTELENGSWAIKLNAQMTQDRT